MACNSQVATCFAGSIPHSRRATSQSNSSDMAIPRAHKRLPLLDSSQYLYKHTLQTGPAMSVEMPTDNRKQDIRGGESPMQITDNWMRRIWLPGAKIFGYGSHRVDRSSHLVALSLLIPVPTQPSKAKNATSTPLDKPGFS